MLVDARGERCPVPVLRLAKLARDAPHGTEIDVWATDPAAGPDIRAWARMRGHEFLGSEPWDERAAGMLETGWSPDEPQNADDDGASSGAVVVRVRVVRPT